MRLRGFIDNEGARANLINGNSPDIDTSNMLPINARFDAEFECLIGYGSGMRRTLRSIGHVSAIRSGSNDSHVVSPLTKNASWTQWSHTRTHLRPHQDSNGCRDASSHFQFGTGSG